MRKLPFICIFAFTVLIVRSAPVFNYPTIITQPDGTVIERLISGDEFFIRIHDENGFTVIKGDNGWYYYAVEQNGNLVPSRHRVGRVDPTRQRDLRPNATISFENYSERRNSFKNFFRQDDEYHLEAGYIDRLRRVRQIQVAEIETTATESAQKKTMHSGSPPIDGIVIYISFMEEDGVAHTGEFTRTNIDRFHRIFDVPEGDPEPQTLRNYFRAMSYGEVDIRPFHIPANKDPYVPIRSFVAPQPRGFYRQFHAVTNPIGYTYNEMGFRRASDLVTAAVNWVREYHPLPDSLSIDADGDGFADFVTIIARGTAEQTGPLWNMFWAHQGSIWGTHPIIRGSGSDAVRINRFAFQPENHATLTIIAHEAGHTIFNAPDLYHFAASTTHQPTGRWDIMSVGVGATITGITAHAKERYFGFIPTIPTLTEAGTFTLLPLGTSQARSAFRTKSTAVGGNSNEFFVLEFRQRDEDVFENVPGTGLVVTRINDGMRGNFNYRFPNIVDEIYVLRPGASQTNFAGATGALNAAHLSDLVGRNEVSRYAATRPFFSGILGSDANFSHANFVIKNIIDMGDSLIFDFIPVRLNNPPTNFRVNLENNTASLSWRGVDTRNVVLIHDTVPIVYELQAGIMYNVGDLLPGGARVIFTGSETTFNHIIEFGKIHYYRIVGTEDLHYSPGRDLALATNFTAIVDTIDNFLSNDTEFYNLTLTAPQGGFGGYQAGHNRFTTTRFAEFYTNTVHHGARLGGVNFKLAKLQNNSGNGQIGLHVWAASNHGLPGQELLAKTIPYTDLQVGWNQHIFESQVWVEGDFFVGLSINYNTPMDTLALFTTSSDPSRPITSYVFAWAQWQTSYALTGLNTALAIRPILYTGGAYIVTVPHSFNNLPVSGVSNQMVNIFTTYSNYEVVSANDWIHIVSVDQVLNKFTFNVEASDTSFRKGAILVIAGNDTVRCFISQGVRPAPPPTSIQKYKYSAISLFPNPSIDGIFYLQSDTDQPMQLDVFDMMGRIIWTGKTSSPTERIDLSTQRSGMYFLRITKGQQQKTFKIVKQ